MADQRWDHLHANVEVWQARRADQLVLAERAWAAAEPSWGIFGIPESQAGLLPDELEGIDAVELGCGTGYVSAWLARRGARPVALDPTPGQLAIAAEFQARHRLRFPLVQAAAEAVPLADASFDLAVSEYGAAIWADPYRWIPEAGAAGAPGRPPRVPGQQLAAHAVRPGRRGRGGSDRLLRDQFGMHRFEWPDDPSVEFHLSHGDWIRLLRANDFEVEDLLELRPEPARTH